MYTEKYHDEKSELVEKDYEENTYCEYCFCTKSLYHSRECSCRYFLIGGCVFPFSIVVDTIALIPQAIVNNIKLCLL